MSELDDAKVRINTAVATLRFRVAPFISDTSSTGVAVWKALEELGYKPDVSQNPVPGEVDADERSEG